MDSCRYEHKHRSLNPVRVIFEKLPLPSIMLVPWKMNVLAISPNGKRIFIASGDCIHGYSVYESGLVDVRSPICTLKCTPGVRINQIRCSFLGTVPVLVACAEALTVEDRIRARHTGRAPDYHDGSVFVFYIDDPDRAPITMWNAESTWGVDVRGRLVAVSSNSHQITLWNMAPARGRSDTEPNIERCLLRGHEHNIPCIAFSPHSDLLASASIDASVRIWDLAAPRNLQPDTGGRWASASCMLEGRPSREWGWAVRWVLPQHALCVPRTDPVWTRCRHPTAHTATRGIGHVLHGGLLSWEIVVNGVPHAGGRDREGFAVTTMGEEADRTGDDGSGPSPGSGPGPGPGPDAEASFPPLRPVDDPGGDGDSDGGSGSDTEVGLMGMDMDGEEEEEEEEEDSEEEDDAVVHAIMPEVHEVHPELPARAEEGAGRRPREALYRLYRFRPGAESGGGEMIPRTTGDPAAAASPTPPDRVLQHLFEFLFAGRAGSTPGTTQPTDILQALRTGVPIPRRRVLDRRRSPSSGTRTLPRVRAAMPPPSSRSVPPPHTRTHTRASAGTSDPEPAPAPPFTSTSTPASVSTEAEARRSEDRSALLLYATHTCIQLLSAETLETLATLEDPIELDRYAPAEVHHMHRLSLLEFLPEVSLGLAASQGGNQVLLFRVLREDQGKHYGLIPEARVPPAPAVDPIAGLCYRLVCARPLVFRVYVLHFDATLSCFDVHREPTDSPFRLRHAAALL